MSDEDRVDVIRPDGGYVNIPRSSLDDAIARGYSLPSDAQTENQQLEEKYGDSPVRSLVEGGLRGATFGLSDLAGSYIDPEGIRERKERNPIAAGVGEVAGTLAPGAGTLIAGAGRAAARIAAPTVAAEGGGLLARAAAKAVPAIARTGAEGGLMGFGSGVSDVALSKDPMSAEAIVGSLATHTALGVGLGSSTGLAGEGITAAVRVAGNGARRVANEVIDRLSADGGIKALTPEVQAAIMAPEVQAADRIGLKAMEKSEKESLLAVRSEQSKVVAQEIRDYYSAADEVTGELFGKIPKGTAGVGSVRRDLRSATRSMQRAQYVQTALEENPGQALKALQFQDQALKNAQAFLPEGALDDVLAKNATVRDKIAALSGEVRSAKLEAIEARMDQLANPAGTGLVKQGVGAIVGGVVGTALGGFGGLGAVLGREIAGGATNYITRKIMGRFASTAEAISNGAKSILTKTGNLGSPMRAITELATAVGVKQGEDAYSRATNAITDAATNIAATRSQIHDDLAGIRAEQPELADQVEAKLLAKVQFLASKVPKVGDGVATFFGKTKVEPSDTEKAAFGRYLAAANDPLRLIKELKAHQVTSETIETHKALYSETLNRLRQQVMEQLSDPETRRKVPYALRTQLAMVFDSPTDPTLSGQFMAAMQQNFVPDSGGHGKGAAAAANGPTTEATQAQRLGE